MNVLLIEDSAAFAIPIQQELAARGIDYTWIVGAQRLENGRIVGILANPSAEPMGDAYDQYDESRLIEIDPTKFDIALCDGGLCGPVKDGVDFVQFLNQRKVPCIAITGGAVGNKRLLEEGAIDGLPKEFVVLALRSGKLDLSRCIRSLSCSRQLQQFCDNLKQQIHLNRNNGVKTSLGYPYFDRCA